MTDLNIANSYIQRPHSSKQPSLHVISEQGLSKQNSLLILFLGNKVEKNCNHLSGDTYSRKCDKPKLTWLPHMPSLKARVVKEIEWNKINFFVSSKL